MMKQKDIAAKAKLSRSYICELISTKKRPAYKTAKKLFKITGIDTILWLEGTTEDLKTALDTKIAPTTKQTATTKNQEVS